ncbi:MAG: glycosyltransferase family 39 protein [Candidatus Thorarchaeota archaeon]
MNHSINSHKTNCQKNGHNYINVVPPLPIIFLIVILFFCAWVRFEGITEQGIGSGDNFRYVREAKIWVEGQPPKFARIFYRPVSYFLHGMAIRMFGYNDYSIKMLHGIMDLISILLIFIIASILARDLWAGVASSLIYAFLPNVVYLVRAELVHVESTFFALLAFLFVILFADKTKNTVKYFLLFISGFSLGLAANTHGDLAFLAPGYVLYLFLKSYDSQSKKESFKDFLILASIFSFAFFTPYFLGLLLFGIKKVMQVLLSEISAAQFGSVHIFGQVSKPLIFLNILYYLIKYYFTKLFFIGILFVGAIFIMIYRKKKKENDPLLVYLPLILIFSQALLFSCFFDGFSKGGARYLMPLLPMVIFFITYWYNKFFKQFFGKYSLIAFIFLFLIIFLLNPKVIPGKKWFKSDYRFVYDILKDDVNLENKILIAPTSIYSFDRGFKLDLYFGKNAFYMAHLPIKDEYNLKSLKELLKDMNFRYIFLGKRIDHRFIGKKFPLKGIYQRWFRNPKDPYSLKKDLEIIQAYIKSKGGLLINKNRFGKIYFLSGYKQKPGLIPNGSFEHWWRGFPMGEWRLKNGRVSRSYDATDGLSSMCFDPPLADNKKGVSIFWVFKKALYKDGSKLRVRLDAKAGKFDKFDFFLNATINEKRQAIKPGVVRYRGKGEWVTLSEDFEITPDMKSITFCLRLQAGARESAFVDNLSIIPVRRD